VNHQLIGFVSVRDFSVGNDTLGEISALYLHPDYWRKNLGTKIYLAALDELSNLGYKKVLLWVLADNAPARSFYETLGMHATGATQLKEFYEGGALLTEVLYECSLGAK
jgi:ribosomal protein S18 acetylase RimI-like enzyme